MDCAALISGKEGHIVAKKQAVIYRKATDLYAVKQFL